MQCNSMSDSTGSGYKFQDVGATHSQSTHEQYCTADFISLSVDESAPVRVSDGSR